MHAVELVFTYEDPEAAALIAAAVRQELGEIEGDRTRTTLAREGNTVRIDIDADDLIALRAGLNTWSTLVEVAERMVDVGRSRSGSNRAKP